MSSVEVKEVKVKAGALHQHNLCSPIRAWKQTETRAGVVVLDTNRPPDQPRMVS